MLTPHTDDHQELRLSLPNDRRLVTPAIEMLLEYGLRIGALSEKEDRCHTAVALEEALVNGIIHGNLEISSKLRDLNDDSYDKLIALRVGKSPYKDRRVEIVGTYSPVDVAFTIRDEGFGFDISTVPNPLADGFKSRSHGRGMLLMRSLMDEVVYNDKGNQVTLVKRKQKVETGFTARVQELPPLTNPQLVSA